MILTAEMSLYPLREDYVDVIRSFIDVLNTHGELTIVTNAMSTQVRGPFDAVTRAVSETLRHSCEQFGKQVLVVKYIPGSLAIEGEV